MYFTCKPFPCAAASTCRFGTDATGAGAAAADSPKKSYSPEVAEAASAGGEGEGDELTLDSEIPPISFIRRVMTIDCLWVFLGF